VPAANRDVADRARGTIAKDWPCGGCSQQAASLCSACQATSWRRVKLSRQGAPSPFQPGKPVGNVYYGACSWTDRTLIDAGTFYPVKARNAADRLAYYASQFPIVEVDATYYALPSERNAHLWVERTPPDFLLNIKAFGLFTHHPVVIERLPAAVKELLPATIAEKTRVYLRDIPEEAEKLIWEMQAQGLAPLAAAGKARLRAVSVPALVHRQARSHPLPRAAS
jgi:hypothetical protein